MLKYLFQIYIVSKANAMQKYLNASVPISVIGSTNLKVRAFSCLLLFWGIGINIASIHGQSLADKILEQLKVASEDQRQFQVRAKLLSRNAQNGQDSNTLLHLYIDRQNGIQRSLAKVLAPERNKGNVFLNNTNAYWVFYPKLQRSLALSPLSTLAGDLSIGDILAPPPLQIYNPKVLEEDQQKLELELTKTVRNAPYTRIIQYYEGELLQQAEFYGGQKGDILLKRAQYQKPIKRITRQGSYYYFYTSVKILNELQKGSFSVMAFDEPKDINIPSTWFNPNNLKEVS